MAISGRVVETLPSGFTYVVDSVSPSDVGVAEEGQVITFTLIGPNRSFSYEVTAPSGTGSYTFSGVLRDDRGGATDIGTSLIRVGAPPSRPAPPANNPPTFALDMVTYTIEENSPPGTNVGEPVTATDSDGDTLTYTWAARTWRTSASTAPAVRSPWARTPAWTLRASRCMPWRLPPATVTAAATPPLSSSV